MGHFQTSQAAATARGRVRATLKHMGWRGLWENRVQERGVKGHKSKHPSILQATPHRVACLLVMAPPLNSQQISSPATRELSPEVVSTTGQGVCGHVALLLPDAGHILCKSLDAWQNYYQVINPGF